VCKILARRDWRFCAPYADRLKFDCGPVIESVEENDLTRGSGGSSASADMSSKATSAVDVGWFCRVRLSGGQRKDILPV
jgi:hypothetical protein